MDNNTNAAPGYRKADPPNVPSDRIPQTFMIDNLVGPDMGIGPDVGPETATKLWRIRLPITLGNLRNSSGNTIPVGIDVWVPHEFDAPVTFVEVGQYVMDNVITFLMMQMNIPGLLFSSNFEKTDNFAVVMVKRPSEIDADIEEELRSLLGFE